MPYKRHQYKKKNTRYRTPSEFIAQSKFKAIKAKFAKRQRQNKINK